MFHRTMDVAAIEGAAIETYERCGLDPSRPVSTFRIAKALLGPDAIERPKLMIGAPAALITVDGRRRIAIKRSIPIEYARFFCGHELGHLVLEERGGYVSDDLELACDFFGAALMAPRPAIYGLQRAFGFDLPEIASAAGGSETWAALRVGEVLRIPLAVVAQTVRVRGPEEWVWPEEGTLRRWARRPPTGLAKTRLTDDPRRVVLVVDDPTREAV